MLLCKCNVELICLDDCLYVCLRVSVCLSGCVPAAKDLTAVGVTCPSARKRLKFEISKLDVDDGIPRFLPASTIHYLYSIVSWQDIPARYYTSSLAVRPFALDKLYSDVYTGRAKKVAP